jgi:hypothetical protein
LLTQRSNGPRYEYGFVATAGSGSPTTKSELYIWREEDHENTLVCLEADAATRPPTYIVLISAVVDRAMFRTALHHCAGDETSNAEWMHHALYALRGSFAAALTPFAVTPFDRMQLKEVAGMAKSGTNSKEERDLADFLLRLSEVGEGQGSW